MKITPTILQAIAQGRKITGMDVSENGELLRLDLDGEISIYFEMGKAIQVETGDTPRAM